MEKAISPVPLVIVDLGDGETHGLRISHAARKALLSEYSAADLFKPFNDERLSRILLLGLRHKYEGGNLDLTKGMVDHLLSVAPVTPLAVDLGDGEKHKLRFPDEARQALVAEYGSIDAMFKDFSEERLSRCLLLGLKHSFDGGKLDWTEEALDEVMDVRLTDSIMAALVLALGRREILGKVAQAFAQRSPEKNVEAPAEIPATKPILN